MPTAPSPSDAPTGRALIVVDERGENSIVVVPGANHELPLPDVAAGRGRRAVPARGADRHGGRTPSQRARGRRRHDGAQPGAGRSAAASCSRCATWSCPTSTRSSCSAARRRCCAAGCRAVVVTRGGGRCRRAHRRRRRRTARTSTVDVVDTTGAGDAFCGSLAARLAAGDELLDAVRWAAAAGRPGHHRPAAPCPPTDCRADSRAARRSHLTARSGGAASSAAQPSSTSVAHHLHRCQRVEDVVVAVGEDAGHDQRATASAVTRRRSPASSIRVGARMLATTTSNSPSTQSSGVVDASIRSATPLRSALSRRGRRRRPAMSIAVARLAPASTATIASTPARTRRRARARRRPPCARRPPPTGASWDGRRARTWRRARSPPR